MLADMHPDVARVSWLFNRWHHKVDYRPFAINKLILKDAEFNQEPNIDNYTMDLFRKDI